MVRSTPCRHSLIRFGYISVIKKGPQRAPGSRTAKHRGWDYPPPAVRPATTRISNVAKLRTNVPLVRKLHFICIAAAPVKLNAAGIRRHEPAHTSNARLKSERRA